MPDHQEDLETLQAAISRAMEALESSDPDTDTRDRLNKELAILVEMWLKISSAAETERVRHDLDKE
jgi:hypothetical protein